MGVDNGGVGAQKGALFLGTGGGGEEYQGRNVRKAGGKGEEEQQKKTKTKNKNKTKVFRSTRGSKVRRAGAAIGYGPRRGA